MGVSLGGGGENNRHVALSWGGFHELLELAYENGWEPMGTEAPMLHYNDGRVERAKDWCGTYNSNNYQIVTADDAANIAAALEKVWDDIPDNPHGWKCLVKEFIELCRGGSFHIG